MKIKHHKNPPLRHKDYITAIVPIGNKFAVKTVEHQVILSEGAFNALLMRFNATLSSIVGKRVWLTIEDNQIKNITE